MAETITLTAALRVSLSDLNRRERKAKKEVQRPYPCAHCQRRFTAANNLFQHMRDSGHGDGTQSDRASQFLVASIDVIEASQKVLEGLYRRLDACKETGEPAPVFFGISELACAVVRAKMVQP